MRSKNSTANTTSVPAIAPMIIEAPTVTNAQGAVMATRPARQPLMVMPRSGLPATIQQVAVEVNTAMIAAVLVVIKTVAIASGSAFIVEPGLNPNQPSHKTNRPITATDMLWPGIGLTLPFAPYLPKRGPSTITPARAAQPPTECTTVEPAKSRKPSSASQPPPQIQWPTIG